jgi:hypothetical protein
MLPSRFRLALLAIVPVCVLTGWHGVVAEEAQPAAAPSSTPAHEAVRQLLTGQNVVIIYSNDGVEEVRVYGRQQRGATRLPPGREVVRTDEAARIQQLENEATSHTEPRRRLSALDRLAARARPEVLSRVSIDVLARESDRAVLERALEIVRDHPGFPVEPLLALAGSNQAAPVRIEALKQLTERAPQDHRLVETLRRALNDPASAVRSAARRLVERMASE